MNTDNALITGAYIVPGKPHVLLAHDQSDAWQSLHEHYAEVANDIRTSGAEQLLIYSTQWMSVIGHLVQADPKPTWLHVDPDWYDLGEMPYEFSVDAEFAKILQGQHHAYGLESARVNYYGFPIDTGTIVALKHLNPDNRIPAGMVSCNMYAEKNESMTLGIAAGDAIREYGKKTAIILVTSLSNRFFTTDINPSEDRVSSRKDDEWNRKILELLGQGRLEDVVECARDFAHEANADMKFKAIYWLSGVVGKSNRFRGHVYDYQPVWGTGNALVKLTPAETELHRSDTRQKDYDELVVRKKKDSYKPVSSNSALRNQSANADVMTSPATTAEILNSERAPLPVGPYPHARKEGNLLYLSGVGPRSRDSAEIPGVVLNDQGEIVSYDVATQTRSVIDNIRYILEDNGSDLQHIIDITVFLTDMKSDFKRFNDVYKSVFTSHQPSRTTVGVTALPTPIAVEFKVIAKLAGT